MPSRFFVSEEMKRIKKRIVTVIFVMLFVLLFGTFAYMYLEGWSFVDSLYFSTVTLTTIGYGDIYPTTTASKFFTVVFIMVGVAVTLNALTFLGNYYYRYFENKQNEIHSNLTDIFGKMKSTPEEKWVTLKAGNYHKIPEDIIFENKYNRGNRKY